MIRVCFMADPAFLGGAEHYVAELATALDRARFEPAVVMRAVSDGALNAWADDLERSGVRVERVPMRLPRHPGDALRIMRVLDDISPRVVHVNVPGPYDGQNGLLLPIARLCGARTVVTEHLPMIARTPRRGFLKSLTYQWLDVAVTMTRSNAASLRAIQGVPAGRIRVVANGVRDVPRPADTSAVRAEVGVKDGEVLIWYVGNILEHKGLHRLIEALSRCASRGWRLGVMGDGPERGLAERTARACGVEGSVSFLGRRPGALVREALSAGDALALPSRWEGLPYVILEAMAAGLPVVAGAAFGVPEVVTDGETGCLVPPDDVPAITRALDRLLSDPALRARMGAAGRTRFEACFTLERQVAAMEALYRELAR